MRAVPAVLEFAARRDRGLLKARLVSAFFHGEKRERIFEFGRRFAAGVAARGCRPAALRALAEHRVDETYLVLLSASPDIYVRAVGAALGFSRVVSSEIEFVGERLTGRLATANRRGEEKLRCVQALRAEFPQARFMAYGNAQSDIAHLKSCDEGVFVNGRGGARRSAAAAGLRTQEWQD